MATHHLAQLNLGVLRHPLDHPDMAEFVAALGPVNQLAESTPGFVWRLQGDDGSSSSYVEIPGAEDPLLAVNYSIWRDLESLRHFMYKSGHATYLRRRREWFAPSEVAMTACWWVPAGTIPDLAEAIDRLEHLRAHGSSPHAWTLAHPEPAPA